MPHGCVLLARTRAHRSLRQRAPASRAPGSSSRTSGCYRRRGVETAMPHVNRVVAGLVQEVGDPRRECVVDEELHRSEARGRSRSRRASAASRPGQSPVALPPLVLASGTTCFAGAVW